ncbi:cellulose synthesis regulatory protein [Geobacter sp. OR-1]|uniref:sensor domain-containing diguanylate cyclase n=1 Tax=Geobacter sp. OR-1 TaxID=1266765 RepID=UPI000541DBC2|nr:GGDEF domain-containing protein [Geobacter sp. OR-1]GAM10317.1 cellulose synthesis regulatory protein [Geobacter sp. OR-1]
MATSADIIKHCRERIEALLSGETPDPIEIPAKISPEARELCHACNRLITAQKEAATFLAALANGNLEVEPPPRNLLISPFKQLHASLRHLVWQTSQVAAGDLDQHVDFLGELSTSFNKMIESLRQKQTVEELLRYLSNHDPMTGLYNRLYFNEELARLDRSRQIPSSIIIADLNGLKQVNDSQGHEAGDLLILAAAEIIRAGVRADDVAARIGGDEFAVILPFTRYDEAETVLKRIRKKEAIQRNRSDLQVHMAYGLATAEQQGEMAAALKLADKRMYEEKFAARNSSCRCSANGEHKEECRD